MTLHDLAERYAVDKLYRHSYIPVYSKLFAELFPTRKITNLLEIGIGFKELMEPFVPKYIHGASLKMWQDYFEPPARIYGADIHPHTMITEGRIESFRVDQSKYDSVRELAGQLKPLSVVIDDGSHVHDHQVMTAAILLPKLQEGSVYIVEDVWPDKGQILADMFGGVLFRGNKTDDDNLVVIRR